MNESTLSKEDRQELVQQTIDLDVLEKYYHAELPDRKPLRVLKNAVVTEDLALKKFGAPVRVIAKGEEGAPFLEIRKVDATGAEATVHFAYPIEGIGGEAKFVKKDGAWQLQGRHLSER